MIYEVTYQVDGQERTDRVDAPDAAGAAAAVRDAHDAERFELILVHLVDEHGTDGASPLIDDRGLAAGV